MNTITLRVIDGLWHATHGGPRSARVVELFGTDTLPTPWGGSVAPDVVLGRIVALNPNYRVVLG